MRKLIHFFSFLFLVGTSFAVTGYYYKGYLSAVVDTHIAEKPYQIEYMVDGRVTVILDDEKLDPRIQQALIEDIESLTFVTTATLEYSPSPIKTHNQSGIGDDDVWELMPSKTLYATPLADPKWPRFSVGLQHQFKNIYGQDLFALSFGENLPLLVYRTKGCAFELGVQAGLTGIMDVRTKPTRLINSDYFVGVGGSFTIGNRWQNLVQFSHLSTHLGDELLVSQPSLLNSRINLSYEMLKWFTAYQFDYIRPYASVGFIVHRDPSTIKRLQFEYGFDFKSEDKFFWESTRYVFGFHAFHWQENDYKPSISIRQGLQLENPVWNGRQAQLLLDYGYGKSRQGQFYNRNEHYLGFILSLSR